MTVSPMTSTERTFLERHMLFDGLPSSKLKDRVRLAYALFMAQPQNDLSSLMYSEEVLVPLREYTEELKQTYASLWQALCDSRNDEYGSMVFDCSFSPADLERIQTMTGFDFTPGRKAFLEAACAGKFNLKNMSQPLHDDISLYNKPLYNMIYFSGRIPSVKELQTAGNERLKYDMLRIVDDCLCGQRLKQYGELYAHLYDLTKERPAIEESFPAEHFADILPSDIAERLSSSWNVGDNERPVSPFILEQLNASGNDPEEAFARLVSMFDENGNSVAEKLQNELRILTALSSAQDYRERLYSSDEDENILLTL